jgi:uncharacterized DUF497 family protein
LRAQQKFLLACYLTAQDRFITMGHLDDRLVVLVWTPRDDVRRVISMRKANEREKAFYDRYMD